MRACSYPGMYPVYTVILEYISTSVRQPRVMHAPRSALAATGSMRSHGHGIYSIHAALL